MSSYGAELAEANSNAAKFIFEYWGPRFWNVNPGEIFKRSAWNTDEVGGVIASGIGGATTGFGADIFIIDDYIKDGEEAESLLKRKKIWTWWQSVASTRLHPGAVVIILATRWNDDDLIGRLLKQKEEEKEEFPFEMEYINLPALAEGNDPLGRNEGEALWVDRYNRDNLLAKKAASGPFWWAAMYQGGPVARGGNLFKSDNFRYYDIDLETNEYLCYRINDNQPIRIKKSELIRHCYVDPSLEIKTTNDPTGMAAWGYSAKYKIWLLLDRMNDRIEHTKAMNIIKVFAFKNGCSLIGIENEKLGKVLVKQSAGNDQINNIKIPSKEIPTNGLDKWARAVPMATYMEQERVFFPRNIHWLADYEDSLVRFPNAVHDEDVDITSMARFMEVDFKTEVIENALGVIGW